MAKLVYRGSKANLPSSRDANSFYLCEDTRELYFGANLYTEAVRFYTATKPAAPAQGVLYVDTGTGAGDIWNGAAWQNVFKGYATVIDSTASDNTVPTTKAAKDYVDSKNANLDALIGDDVGKSIRDIASEELAKQLIPDDAKASLDTLAEIAKWIQEHPDDAAAMNQAIQALQNLVGTLPSGATSTSVVAYIKEYCDAAIAALNIGDYAKAADLASAITRIAALEAKSHDHANAAELDKIADGDKAKWDAAADAIDVGSF